MKLWDRFVNQDKPQGNKHLPESLVRFARIHKEVLHGDGLRSEFWKFLLNLKQYNRISNMVVKSAIAVVPSTKDIFKTESPKPSLVKSPLRSPKTPIGKRGAPVPSAVNKTDEGSYCLCRSVWCNGMVACSNEDCKIEWYHLGCINLWQKPVGKWVCPKYISPYYCVMLTIDVTLCKIVNVSSLDGGRTIQHEMLLRPSVE
jgi:hypothetical protein